MSRTNRRSINRNRPIFLESDVDDEDEDSLDASHDPDEPIPVDVYVADDETRLVLEAVFNASRNQLVATARHHLRSWRDDAEDVVHDVCQAALEGQIPLPRDPSGALDALRWEIVTRCREITHGHAS